MKILNIKQVADKTSLSRWTIERMVTDDKFPKPIMINDTRKGWLENEIDKWIKLLPRKG